MSVLTATNSTLRDPGVDHPVERVQPGAADADDADDGQVRGRVGARRGPEARRLLGQRLDPAGLRARLGLGRRLGRPRRRLATGSASRSARQDGTSVTGGAVGAGGGGARRRRSSTSGSGSGVNGSGSGAAAGCSSPSLRGLLGLPLGGLGRAEELRERALTHACALSRH